MSTVITWLNALGLASNMIGVGLAFKWGFPQPTFDSGFRRLQNSTPNSNETSIARERVAAAGLKITHQRLSVPGLILMFLGFGLQLIAVLLPVLVSAKQAH